MPVENSGFRPERDAWAAIRGYVYQARSTVLRWLALDDTVLFCEWGEDLALIKNLDPATPDAPECLLEQIKYRTRHITLRTPHVVDVLANFLDVWTARSGSRLRLRFNTNADPGHERDTAFPSNRTGIEAWRRAGEPGADEAEVREILAGIRRVVGRPTPGIVPDEDRRRQRLREFATTATDEELLQFVRAVEWAMGQPDHELLPADIEARLVERKMVTHETAKVAADRLTVAVLDTLSTAGEKRLDAAGLRRALEHLALSDRDRGVLEHLFKLQTAVERLMSAMPVIEARVTRLETVTGDLQTTLRAIERGAVAPIRTGDAVDLASPTPLLDAPPSPLRYAAPRARLIENLVRRSISAGWLHLCAGTGMGKTYSARALLEAHAHRHRGWISMSGFRDRRDEPSAVRHLDDQIVAWATNVSEDPGWWRLYREGQINPLNLAAAVLTRVGDAVTFVVDDLPDLAVMPSVSQGITMLARILQTHGGVLVTTGQWPLSPIEAEAEGVPVPEIVQVERMDVNDIRELLLAAGAPEQLLTAEVLDLLQTATAGHPSLVLGTVRGLETQGWVLNADRLVSILTGEASADEREAARRQMVALVPDENQREMLCRLSLAGRAFGRDIVDTVAAVPSALGRPGELLEQLVGPWVSRLGEDRYEVSPLLTDVGRHHLAEDQQRAIHIAIADHLLRPRPVKIEDALHVLVHLGAAQDWLSFAAIHIQVMIAASTEDQARWIAPVVHFFPTSAWPEAIPLPFRMMIRALQVKTAVLAGKDATDLTRDADDLIAHASQAEPDQAAAVFALVMLAMYGQVSSGDAMRWALEASRVARIRPDVVGDLPGAGANLGGLVWLPAMKAQSFDDALGVIGGLRSMTPEDARAAWSVNFALQASRIVVDRIWASMAQRPEADRDWQAVLHALEEVEAIAEVNGLPGLRVLATRGRAMVLSDYLGRAGDALAVLETAETTNDKDCLFMARFTRASILMDEERWRESADEYERALQTPGDGFENDRFVAHAWAVAVFGRLQQWDQAVRYAQAGLSGLHRKHGDEYFLAKQTRRSRDLQACGVRVSWNTSPNFRSRPLSLARKTNRQAVE